MRTKKSTRTCARRWGQHPRHCQECPILPVFVTRLVIWPQTWQDLDAGIKELEAEAERVLPAIEEFCVSISDPRMRLIFRLRFVRCRSWAEIAGTLGRYYTEAGVCKMAYNYLKKIA